MNRSLWVSSLALAAALAVGCDEGTSKSVTATVDSAAKTAEKAGGDAAAAAKDAAASGFDAIKGQVEEMYTKAQDAVKAQKWDDAQGALDKIMAFKDKLPAEWTSKLDSLKSAIDAGKKAMGVVPKPG